MKALRRLGVLVVLLTFLLSSYACSTEMSGNGANSDIKNEESGSSVGSSVSHETEQQQLIYILPAPATDSDTSVETALVNRRSHRDFQEKAITMEQLSQILWAAYGVTLPRPYESNLRGGLRTAPSAGALYPLEVYAIVGNVEGIEPGVYRYISGEHKIEMVVSGDIRNELMEAAMNQRMVAVAPASLFYSAVPERTTGRYGERGNSYIYIEVGHSAQNVYLQAEALGLGTCAIGAFSDSAVRELLNLPSNEEPLYLMPFGYVSG